MLTRALRLSRTEVTSVVANGRRLGNRDLGFRLTRNPSGGTTRLGFVVSGREVKTAVARHRLKRRLRAIVNHPRLKIKPGYRIVIFAGQTASSWTFNELKNNLTNIFNDL